MITELYEKMHKTTDYRQRNQGLDCIDMWYYKLPIATCGGSIIEIGCGNGLLCKRLAKDGWKVTGVDIIDGDYDRKGYEFIKADLIKAVGFDIKPYDYCLCFDVLEHLKTQDVIPQALRLMAENNIIIFSAACYGRPPLHLTVETPGWWLDAAIECCPDFDWQVLKVFNRYDTHKSPVILLYGKRKEKFRPHEGEYDFSRGNER